MILTRRSIRRFKDDLVEENKIDDLLSAAMHAPSAANQQPWEFLAVTEKEMLMDLSGTSPYATPLKSATLAIVVCVNKNLVKFKGNEILDCSAATQNILLAAHALGLGSVWLGVYPEKERINSVSNVLALPEHIEPFSLIAIGYPEEEPKKVNRYNEARIHREMW